MTVTAYDEIAEWYDNTVREGSLLHDLVLPTLFDLIGNVEGLGICDLACGQGVVARHLAKSGAAVVGVDTSARLLDIAQRYEAAEPLGILYRHDDAQALATLPDAAYDGVVCSMSLMDIRDVAATFRAVQRILRPNGWFVFSITHPCVQTPTSTWTEKVDGTVWREVRGTIAQAPPPLEEVWDFQGCLHLALDESLLAMLETLEESTAS